MSRLQRFQLLSGEQIQNSPSRADGVPENMEARRRKLAAQHMRDVAHKFNMRITTWAIAVTFFNRFYARKSMKKNNTFVIACASLFLAGKANDEPQPHQRLTNELLKAWYGRDNPQLVELAALGAAAARGAAGGAPGAPLPRTSGGHAPTFWRDTYDAVLEAERALLYTVGFDFNVDIIHTWLARLLNRPRFKALGLLENKNLQQWLIGMANDVYHKDGTMVLQYPVEKIAAAALYFVYKATKANKAFSIPMPAPGPDGTPWYVEEGLTPAECAELTTRFTDRLYSSSGSGQKAVGGAGAGSTRPAPSGAASTAMLGACESAAYSGGGPTLGGVMGGGGTAAAARSEVVSGSMGDHTSVPRPLGSDSMAAPSGTASKRPAPSPPGGSASVAAPPKWQDHPAKRARPTELAAAGSNEATSSVVHPSQLGMRSPAAAAAAAAPPARPGSLARPNGTAAAHAAPVPAADAAADSDKEEGELEEGELAS